MELGFDLYGFGLTLSSTVLIYVTYYVLHVMRPWSLRRVFLVSAGGRKLILYEREVSFHFQKKVRYLRASLMLHRYSQCCVCSTRSSPGSDQAIKQGDIGIWKIMVKSKLHVKSNLIRSTVVLWYSCPGNSFAVIIGCFYLILIYHMVVHKKLKSDVEISTNRRKEKRRNFLIEIGKHIISTNQLRLYYAWSV